MNTTTETPLTEFQIIDPLAVEIQTAWEKAFQHAKRCREEDAEMKAAACNLGELLEAAKARHRNEFPLWLATNIPNMSLARANFFISQAKKARLVGLENINGRQLMLNFENQEQPEEESAPHINRDPDGTRWFSFFERAVGCFAKQIEFRPVQEWTEAERVAFKRRAEPIVKVWGEL